MTGVLRLIGSPSQLSYHLSISASTPSLRSNITCHVLFHGNIHNNKNVKNKNNNDNNNNKNNTNNNNNNNSTLTTSIGFVMERFVFTVTSSESGSHVGRVLAVTSVEDFFKNNNNINNKESINNNKNNNNVNKNNNNNNVNKNNNNNNVNKNNNIFYWLGEQSRRVVAIANNTGDLFLTSGLVPQVGVTWCAMMSRGVSWCYVV